MNFSSSFAFADGYTINGTLKKTIKNEIQLSANLDYSSEGKQCSDWSSRKGAKMMEEGENVLDRMLPQAVNRSLCSKMFLIFPH